VEHGGLEQQALCRGPGRGLRERVRNLPRTGGWWRVGGGAASELETSITTVESLACCWSKPPLFLAPLWPGGRNTSLAGVSSIASVTLPSDRRFTSTATLIWPRIVRRAVRGTLGISSWTTEGEASANGVRVGPSDEKRGAGAPAWTRWTSRGRRSGGLGRRRQRRLGTRRSGCRHADQYLKADGGELDGSETGASQPNTATSSYEDRRDGRHEPALFRRLPWKAARPGASRTTAWETETTDRLWRRRFELASRPVAVGRLAGL